MVDFATEVLAEGFDFLEGPRWHDGRLWMSDMFQRKVLALDVKGRSEKVVNVPGKPSGLGFLPDGTPLVVSMEDQTLYRIVDGSLVEHAVLGPHVQGDSNDMVVDSLGRAYVGHFGFDLFRGAEFQPANIVMVTPDGDVTVVARDLSFPNGMVILEDRDKLVVAETRGLRLTAFDIAADGLLSAPRTYADLGAHSPDGICLDQESGIWVSSTDHDAFLRITPGGNVVDRIGVPGRRAVACQLGGDDGRTLFCLTCSSTWKEVFAGHSRSQVEVARVEIPGAGSP